MAATRATTTNIGMANKAASGRRPNRGTTEVHQALQFIRRIAILQLRNTAEFCITPRRFSLVETTPFIDPRQFEWHALATSEWTNVQSELKALLSAVDKIPSFQEISEDQKVITDDDKWRTYFFYVYGQRFEKQCGECPGTARLLQKIPGMKTAFFSILSPGKQQPTTEIWLSASTKSPKPTYPPRPTSSTNHSSAEQVAMPLDVLPDALCGVAGDGFHVVG
jgi:ornithine lipid ester-linked acyl 2-hydroxylase